MENKPEVPRAAPARDPEARYKYRVERRLKFVTLLAQARLGVYLPAEEATRRQLALNLARSLAHPSELSRVRPELFAAAAEQFLRVFETMQGDLPHDVQYRNRIRSRQVW